MSGGISGGGRMTELEQLLEVLERIATALERIEAAIVQVGHAD